MNLRKIAIVVAAIAFVSVGAPLVNLRDVASAPVSSFDIAHENTSDVRYATWTELKPESEGGNENMYGNVMLAPADAINLRMVP